MKRWNWQRLLATVAACLLLWGVVAAACICVGSNGHIAWPVDKELRHARMEPVLISSLIGAALAAAGVTYQAILRNPLADPYLLGVSSGATLAAYLWRLEWFGMGAASLAAVLSQQGFAFGGAIVSIAIVLVLASNRGRLEPVTLLLVGVIVNAINGAIYLLINLLRPELVSGVGGPLAFLVGGIQTNLDPSLQRTAAVCVGVGWLVLLYLTGAMNAAALGDAEAQALGVSIHRLRWVALGVASIVTGAAVAISGPIGFVGLICPHLTRLIVGHDQRRILPIATALGAALLAVADAGSRLLSSQRFGQTTLPVGVLTALMGGPFFLVLLWRQRHTTMAVQV